MAEPPEIPRKLPYPLVLPAGDYLWCACGRSKTQPFCDGSHAGTGFQPIKYTVSAGAGYVWWCGCKHSKIKPLCDGTHNRL